LNLCLHPTASLERTHVRFRIHSISRYLRIVVIRLDAAVRRAWGTRPGVARPPRRRSRVAVWVGGGSQRARADAPRAPFARLRPWRATVYMG